MNIFKLPPHILSNLSSNHQISEVDDPSLNPTVTAKSNDIIENEGMTCATCAQEFTSITDQRSHFKSDFHSYNLKRKLWAKQPVTEEEFDLNLETLSIGSLEGDDDEADDDEEGTVKVDTGSPFILFDLLDNAHVLSAYKQIFMSSRTNNNTEMFVDRIKMLQEKPKTWAIIMLASGHFSASIFDCFTGELTVMPSLLLMKI